MAPSITVVIPCYNMELFVGEAIESVLRQDHVDFECIVVDDGSTDSSLEVIQRYSADRRLRIIKQRNVGHATAHNTGLRNATGKYVAFLDADDYWVRSDVLARWERILDDHDDVAVVYSDVMAVDEFGMVLGSKLRASQSRPSGMVLLDMFQHNFVYLGAAATRLSLARAIGGFDTSIRGMLDYLFWLRLSAMGKFEYCPSTVLAYRQRHLSYSRNYQVMAEATYRTHIKFAREAADSLPKPLVNDVLASDLLGIARTKAGAGRRAEALKAWWQSFALRLRRPLLIFEPRFCLTLAGAVLGMDLVTAVKRMVTRGFAKS